MQITDNWDCSKMFISVCIILTSVFFRLYPPLSLFTWIIMLYCHQLIYSWQLELPNLWSYYFPTKFGQLKVYVTKFTFWTIYHITIVGLWFGKAPLLITMTINLQISYLIQDLGNVYLDNCYTFHLFWDF